MEFVAVDYLKKNDKLLHIKTYDFKITKNNDSGMRPRYKEGFALIIDNGKSVKKSGYCYPAESVHWSRERKDDHILSWMVAIGYDVLGEF